MTDLPAILGDRCDALTDTERERLLHWLCGYAPAAVQRALDCYGSRCSDNPAGERAS